MPDIDEAFVKTLLANTELLFANIHAFECKNHSLPGTSHRGVSITHQDLNERRKDFIEELRNTISSWIYSKAEYKKILKQALQERGGDLQNASSFLQALAKSKFRIGFPQGQFGELLLFNLLQHYFSAAPLLRKMPITTNPKIERHGADAIHYIPEQGVHKLFLGEAKSYTSKYKFSEALKDGIDSILDTHENFPHELALYIYDDFLDSKLTSVARKIKNNELSPLRVELVCVISYDEQQKKSGTNEHELKESIRKIVENRLTAFDPTCFDGKCTATLSRLHIFAMPVWDFDGLLKEFEG